MHTDDKKPLQANENAGEMNHGTSEQYLSKSPKNVNGPMQIGDDSERSWFFKGKWSSFRGLFGKDTPKQPSKLMKVQLFVPINTATTKDFSNAITDLFGDIPFNCLLSGIGNLSENLPLVVVCPICSRFEPDIDCAIYGINWNKIFVVLLLHSGSKSSIPRIPTASKLAHMEKYKNIVFIDIAYTIDAKLYQCQMNEDAKVQLRRFFQNLQDKM